MSISLPHHHPGKLSANLLSLACCTARADNFHGNTLLKHDQLTVTLSGETSDFVSDAACRLHAGKTNPSSRRIKWGCRKSGAGLFNKTYLHVLTVVIKEVEKEIPATLHKEGCEERIALLSPSL